MEILGFKAGPVRPPLTNTRPQDVADIERLMDVFREYVEEGEPGSSVVRSSVGAGGVAR
jgi:hypothetical protein